MTKELTQVLKKPIITEKSMRNVGFNQYTFEVDKKASKSKVAQALKKMFEVEVYRVTVLNRRGKKRRFTRTRQEKLTPYRRFAIVTINPKDKDKMKLFEEVKEEE